MHALGAPAPCLQPVLAGGGIASESVSGPISSLCRSARRTHFCRAGPAHPAAGSSRAHSLHVAHDVWGSCSAVAVRCGRLVVRGHCRSKAGLRRRSRARRSKTTFARHTPSTARVQDTWRCRAQQDAWRCAASHSGCFARHWARHWPGLCCACAPVDVRTLRERCTPALWPGRLADIRSATLQQCCAMLQPCRSCAGI